MTTDTVPKQVALHHAGNWTVGGMAKGAGMLAPSLATMLCVITTDAVADAAALDHALRSGQRPDLRPARRRRQLLDQRHRAAAGLRGQRRSRRARTNSTTRVLRVCDDLCAQLQADAEGVTKRVVVTVTGAADEADALTAARVVARDSLVKTALVRLRPQLGPRACRGRDGAGPAGPGADQRVVQRIPGVRRRRRGAGRARCRPVRRRYRGDDRPRCRRRRAPRSGPPTCRTRTSKRTRRTARDFCDVAGVTIHTTKADVLAAALPWLKALHGKIVVVKYGGNAMTDDALQAAFAADMVFLRNCGIHPVVVHGGGPQISAMLKRLGIAGDFKGGFRVTTPEVLDVARMVLFGQVGRELVNLINAHGPYAVGITGEDAHLFTAVRRSVTVDGVATDIGLVGDVEKVNTAAVLDLIAAGRIPVVSTIAPDIDGVVHNINADTAAAALAEALGAEKLLMLTDVEGLYTSWPDRDSLVSEIDVAALTQTAADAGGGHGAEDRGLHARGRWRCAERTRHRRPCRALRAGRAVHRRRSGNEGGARMSLQQRWESVMMNNYGTPAVALASGDGAVVTDVDGKSYLDLLGGIAVNVLGHRHPAVIEAVTTQLNTLGHTSNFYATEPGIALAEALVGQLGGRGPGLPLQLGHRGQRGRLQDQPADGPHQNRCGAGRLPRPDDGIAGADRPARQTGAVRSAARRRRARAVRRCRRVGRSRRRRDRGGLPRADHGGGRRRRPARRLPGGRPRAVDDTRRAAGPRRGADRDGPHRNVFRPSARRHHPRRRHPRQGPRRRPADRCLHRGRSCR